jgi:hypothetical protein
MFSMIVAVGVGILADNLKRQRDLLLFARAKGHCEKGRLRRHFAQQLAYSRAIRC